MSETESATNGPKKRIEKELTAASSTSESGSFTRIFDSLKKEEGAPRQGHGSGLNGGLGNAGSSNAPQAAAEGFTQLFESVKGKTQSAPPHSESVHFPAGESLASPVLSSRNSEGEFTRLLRKVSRRANAAKTASPAPAPKASFRADSPGEFTRIVSQSMRREVRSQSQDKALPDTREAAVAPPDKSGSQQGRSPSASQSRASSPEANSPEKMEHFQSRSNNGQASAAGPINPQAILNSAQESVRMAAGGGLSLPRAVEQVAYTASSRSSALQNTPASLPAAKSRFEEYVPFLLMANLFLTVLLLLLVGFALLHRP